MSATPAPDAGLGLGKPIKGPSAFTGDFRRFVHLTRTLAYMDFKLRFFGSVLGYFWQLMRPLLFFGVLYVVFTYVFKFGGSVVNYPVVLLMNVVLYTFFGEATGASVPAVLNRENLVRKIHFPRLVVPLSAVLTAAFNLGLNVLVVLIFALASGVSPMLSWLELPVLVLLLMVLVSGLAMLLSALYVRFRDIAPIWDVVTQVTFYATPVLYVIDKTYPHPIIRHLEMASPLAAILTQARHAVVDSAAPTALQAAGGFGYLLIPIGVTVGILALGLWVFNREAPRIAENL